MGFVLLLYVVMFYQNEDCLKVTDKMCAFLPGGLFIVMDLNTFITSNDNKF